MFELSGHHNFTLRTLAMLSTFLVKRILKVTFTSFLPRDIYIRKINITEVEEEGRIRFAFHKSDNHFSDKKLLNTSIEKLFNLIGQ